MIRIGQYEYVIPPWLGTVVPLAFGLYATLQLISSLYLSSSLPSASDYFFYVKQISTATIAGFLLIDLARRSIITWYAPLLLFLLTSGVAAVAINWFQVLANKTTMLDLGLLFALAASRPGSSTSGAIALLAGINAIPFVVGAVIALILALGCRILAGLSLLSRDTLRDFWANLAAATIWIALVFAGAFAISHFPAGYSLRLPGWMPLAGAVTVVLAATLVHLALVSRIRRRADTELNSLRSWLAALVCIAILFYSPFSFGSFGVRTLYDYVRPTLRAVHVLPTPPLRIAGYIVDVPFHDLKTNVIREMPDGSTSQVSVPFPLEYGLGGRVQIRRRDAPPDRLATLYGRVDESKELKATQDKAPDRDAVLLMSTTNYTKLAMRLIDYPDVDIMFTHFDRSTSPEEAEQALRRFLRERVRRS